MDGSAPRWRPAPATAACPDQRQSRAGTAIFDARVSGPVCAWRSIGRPRCLAQRRPVQARAGPGAHLSTDGPPMDPSRPRGIVHVVNSLDYGGLERVVADLAIEQRARGLNVRVFSICDTGGFRDGLEAAGVPVTVAGKRRTLDLHVLRLLRR